MTRAEAEKLIERLRAWGENSPDPTWFQGDVLSAVLDDCAKAAAALAAQEAENVAVAEFLDLMNNQIEVTAKANAVVLAEYRARAAAALSENERLRTALEPFAKIAEMEPNTLDGSSTIVNISRCRDAREALSPITDERGGA